MTFIVWLFFCFTALQIAVMITNGRSDDRVDAAATAVADSGISLFAVGECGTRCCEFLQHPHCSGPSDFIWALPAYLQCLQLEIHVLYIWIRRIQCGYLWACVRMLFLSVSGCTHAGVRASVPTSTNYVVYVRISEWLIQLLYYLLYINVQFRALCVVWARVFHPAFSLLMNTCCCLPTV